MHDYYILFHVSVSHIQNKLAKYPIDPRNAKQPSLLVHEITAQQTTRALSLFRRRYEPLQGQEETVEEKEARREYKIEAGACRSFGRL